MPVPWDLGGALGRSRGLWVSVPQACGMRTTMTVTSERTQDGDGGAEGTACTPVSYYDLRNCPPGIRGAVLSREPREQAQTRSKPAARLPDATVPVCCGRQSCPRAPGHTELLHRAAPDRGPPLLRSASCSIPGNSASYGVTYSSGKPKRNILAMDQTSDVCAATDLAAVLAVLI